MSALRDAQRLADEVRSAQTDLDTHPDPPDRLLMRESAAWDAYTDACDAAGKCLDLDCSTLTDTYAYCRDHRPFNR